MVGRGQGLPGVKKKYSVKSFLTEWLAKRIDGVCNDIWLGPGTSGQALCKICTKEGVPKTFSVAEGYTAVTKHSKGDKHLANLARIQTDPNHNLFDAQPQQIGIEGAFENARKKTQESEDRKKVLLEAQIKFAAMVAHHNIPSSFNSCFSDCVSQLFPDSDIAKLWNSSEHGMRETKGDYFVSHGIAKFQREELEKILRENYFSVNFDESSINKRTELDINVSFIKDCRAVKTNFRVIEMLGSTAATDIVEAVFASLDRAYIPRSNIVSISTDGCSTMLGKIGGVHTIMRESLPHLPDWGGCMAHNPSNMLKSATPLLGESFIKAIPAFHSYLSSQSLHRYRSYKDMAIKLGLNPSEIPKMFEVRFRVIVKLADWLCKNDDCVFPFIEDLAGKVKTGEHKEPTETEIILLNHYYDNHLECILSASFISDIGVPILEFLDFFECQTVTRIQERYSKIVEFIYQLSSKYLVNGGLGNASTVSGRELLKVDYQDSELFLTLKKVWIGEKAENCLSDLGLNKESPEIADWMKGVQKFYSELLMKALKYFKPSLESRSLRYMDVLDPVNIITYSLNNLQNRFEYLARKWPNIISPEKIEALKTEVALLKCMQNLNALHDLGPVEFFVKLKEHSGGKKFPLLSTLGLGLLTIYNSSSSAETDFSIMNGIVSDARRSCTSQQRLEDRVRVKSNIYQLRFDCERCKKPDEKIEDNVEEPTEKKRQKHCHCPLWKPSEKLVASMCGGQPSRRYKEELKRNKELKDDDAVLYNRVEEEKSEERRKRLKESFLRLKRRLRQEAAKKMQNQVAEVSKKRTEEEKKEKKRKAREDKEKRIEDKRSRLTFLS